MKVNDKKFQTYTLDTPETVLSRIAALFSTLPKYLYFEGGQPTLDDISSDKNVTVINLLDIIRKFPSEDSIKKLFKEINDKNPKLNPIKDILVPYVIFNKSYENAGDTVSFLLLALQADLDQQNVDVENIWKDRVSSKKKLNKEIDDNKASAISDEDRFKKFQTSAVDMEYTEFELEKVHFEFALNIVDISLSELFNQIILVSGVPIASCNGMYKILKDFVPPSKDWLPEYEDIIILKICQKADVATAKEIDYTNVLVAIDKGKLVAKMDINIGQTGIFLSRTKLIERFISVLRGFDKIEYGDLTETKVNGVFYIPHHDFNKFIFSDITMNEPLFSELASIDESEKASKKKNSVYWHFDHSKTGLVTANITGKTSEQGDAVLRGKDVKNMFPYGSKYIRVKISSADSTEAVAEFQKLFVRLLGVYDINYPEILTFYKKYIPTFGKDVKAKKIEDKQMFKLKNIAPEVFIKG